MGLDDALNREAAAVNDAVTAADRSKREKAALLEQADAEVRALGTDAAARLRDAGVPPRPRRALRWKTRGARGQATHVAHVPESWELIPQELYLSVDGRLLTLWDPLKRGLFRVKHELHPLVVDSFDNYTARVGDVTQATHYGYEEHPYGSRSHRVRRYYQGEWERPLEEEVAKALLPLLQQR